MSECGWRLGALRMYWLLVQPLLAVVAVGVVVVITITVITSVISIESERHWRARKHTVSPCLASAKGQSSGLP